jgi:mRNA guanylyltransferase
MLTGPGLHLPLPSDPTFQSFHQRTILDGELVLDRVVAALVPRFMVFDCLILDGELLVQKSFDRRIGRVHQFVHKPLTKCVDKFPEERKFFPFEVIPKPMEKPYALENVFLQLADLPHGNDGLIFTAKGAVYSFGTDEMIIKWKPPEENTVDFRLYVGEFPKRPHESAEKPVEDQPMEGRPMADKPEERVGDKAAPGTDSPPKAAEIDWDSKPELSLLVFWNRGDYRRLASLYCTDEEWQSLTRNREKLDGRIIECYVDDEGRWRYKREEDGSPRFRDDKTEANHISTVKKIMDSIDDGVSKKDLCAAQHLIYQAWKDRHPEEERLARAQQINSSAKAQQQHSKATPTEVPLRVQKTDPPKYRWTFTADSTRTFDKILDGRVPPNLRNVLDHYLNFGNLPKASRDSLRRMLQIAIETHPEPTSQAPPHAAPKPALKSAPKAAPKGGKPVSKAAAKSASKATAKTVSKTGAQADAQSAAEAAPTSTPQTAHETAPKAATKTTPQTALATAPEASLQTAPKATAQSTQTTPNSTPQTAETTPKGAQQASPKSATQTTPRLAPKLTPEVGPQAVPKLTPNLPHLAPKMAPHMPTPMAFPASHHVDPQVDPQAAQPPPVYLQPHFQAPQMAPPTSPEAARHMAPPAPPQPRPGPLQVAYVGMPMPPPRGYQIAPQAAGPGSPQNTSPVSPVAPLKAHPQSPRQLPPPPTSPHAAFHQSPRGDLQASPPGDAQEAEKPRGKPRGRPKGRKRSLDTAIGETRTIQPAPKRIPNAQLKMNPQAAAGIPHPASIQSPNFMQPDHAGNAARLQSSPPSQYAAYGRSPSKASLDSILQPSAPANPPPRYGQPNMPENLPGAPTNYQPGGQRYQPGTYRTDAPANPPGAPGYRPPPPALSSPTEYRNPRNLDNMLRPPPSRGSLDSILQTSSTSGSPPGGLERARPPPGSPAQPPHHHRKGSLESILQPSPTASNASPTAAAGWERGAPPHPSASQMSPKASLSMILHPNEDGGSPLESRAPAPLPLPPHPRQQQPPHQPQQPRQPPPPHQRQLQQPPPPHHHQHQPPPPHHHQHQPQHQQHQQHPPPRLQRPPPPPLHQHQQSPHQQPPHQQPPHQQQGPPSGSPQGNAPWGPSAGSPTGAKGKSDIHKLLQ